MKRISQVLLKIFAAGVVFSLFAGALSFLGYMLALIIGGETATNLCVFIYKQYFPWIIRLCSLAVACGLFGMYLDKKKALTMGEDAK